MVVDVAVVLVLFESLFAARSATTGVWLLCTPVGDGAVGKGEDKPTVKPNSVSLARRRGVDVLFFKREGLTRSMEGEMASRG